MSDEEADTHADKDGGDGGIGVAGLDQGGDDGDGGGGGQEHMHVEVKLRPEEASLLDLDEYVLETVASYLDLFSLARLAQTCRTLYHLRWPTIDLSLVTHNPSRAITHNITPDVWEYLLSKFPRRLVVAFCLSVDQPPLPPLPILRLRSLRDLRLQHINITSTLASELCFGLRRFKPLLTRLELGCLRVSARNLNRILAAVGANAPTLRHLTLKSLSLRREVLTTLADIICPQQASKQQRQQQQQQQQRQQKGQQSCQQQPLGVLQGRERALHDLRKTAAMSSLRVLEISNCSVRELDELGHALARGAPLQRLSIVAPSLHLCSPGPLYTGLVDNTTLTHLNLSHMQSGSVAADALVQVLVTATALEDLMLPPVQPERDDLQLIIETMAARDQLVSFAWTGITFNVTAVEMLWGWVANTARLRRLLLKHCDFAGPTKLRAQLAKTAARALSDTVLRLLDIEGSELFAARDLRRTIRPLTHKRGIVLCCDDEIDARL